MSIDQNNTCSKGDIWSGSFQLKQLVIELLRMAKRHPVLLKTLNKEIARKVESQRAGLLISVLEDLIGSGLAMDLGKGEYFLTENIERLKDRVCAVIKSHHARHPYEPGLGANEIKKRFAQGKTLNTRRNIDPRLFELAMSACKKDGLVEIGDFGARLSGFTPLTSKNPEIEKVEQAILDYIHSKPFGRINCDQLSSYLYIKSKMTRVVISEMLKNGKLIQIAEGRYLEPAVIERVKSRLVSEFNSKARLRTSEITKALDLTRSKAIPLLEYFDEIGFTQRNGDFRFLVCG